MLAQLKLNRFPEIFLALQGFRAVVLNDSAHLVSGLRGVMQCFVVGNHLRKRTKRKRDQEKSQSDLKHTLSNSRFCVRYGQSDGKILTPSLNAEAWLTTTAIATHFIPQ